jgi:hypothetical protein
LVKEVANVKRAIVETDKQVDSFVESDSISCQKFF